MPVNILPSCSKEVLLVKIESSHSDEWLLFLFFITCHTTLYPINIHYLCSSKSYKSETEVISVEGLSVEFNATPLFEDVSYVINKKDRIALVGKNAIPDTWSSGYSERCHDRIFAAGDDSRR